MACTNKILDGAMLRLYIDGVLIAKDMSTELTIENSTRETTSKTSGGWKAFISGIKGFNISGEALYVGADYAGVGKTPDEVFALLDAGTVVTAKLATTDVAEGYYEGDVILNTMSISSGNAGENVTYSFGAQGTGKLEFKTI